jgi:selenocysteine lyase/cysteine desulfurase
MSLMLLASHPKPVRDAIERHRQALNEDPVTYLETNGENFENVVREAAAQFIGADPSEIVLTDSTTMGLSVIYHGFRFNPGDEILTTTHDHYVTEKNLEFASARSGAVIKRTALYDDPSEANAGEMVERLRKNISSKTRLVAITHVHSGTGVKTPVSLIGAMINEENQKRSSLSRIYFSVDGVHGFGVENSSMKSLGCDFFSAGTHKWMFGPRGTGIVYAKKDAWDMISPVIPPFELKPYLQWAGFLPAGEITFAEMCTPGGFHSFEHRWSLNEAFNFMSSIGKEKIQQRTHELATMMKEGLSQIKHVNLITPLSQELSSGINCFEIKDMDSIEAVKKLHTRKLIASFSPYSKLYVRLTPCILNTEEEVKASIGIVEKILD